MRYACPKCGKSLMRGSNTAAGKKRWVCKTREAYCYSTTNPKGSAVRKQDGSTVKKGKTPIFKRTLGGVNRFIVTAAQNATPAHKGFLKALETACNHLNAELLVVPIRYKNPTSRWPESQANEDIWAPEVAPYLFNQRKALNKNLILLGDVKVQPTATHPLTGFEALTHGESGILAHTKLQLRTVATPQSQLPKILTATGACTVPNYTDSKAGALGEFHHTLGAAMVEVRGKTFHLRQINADKDSGDFIDLEKYYVGSGMKSSFVSFAKPALAIVFGDTHVDFADPKVVKAGDEMCALLKPGVVVFEDVLDGYAVNPHHDGNVFNAIAKIENNRANIREEMMRAFEFIEKHTPKDALGLIVPSNHNDFLTRWIINTDPRTVPGNAKFWAETFLAMARATDIDSSGTTYPEPFAYWGRKHLPTDRFRFLDRDESYQVAGIELGMHGDKGPNGARGSIRNLARIGVKSIIGHTHSPGINEGCYQVGTSTSLKLEYNSGPSGWLNTNAVVYANGKRTLINIIKGEWRL